MVRASRESRGCGESVCVCVCFLNYLFLTPLDLFSTLSALPPSPWMIGPPAPGVCRTSLALPRCHLSLSLSLVSHALTNPRDGRVPVLYLSWSFTPRIPSKTHDSGFPRTEALGVDVSDHRPACRGGELRDWVCDVFVPNDDARIRRGGGARFRHRGARLAVLQPTSAAMAGRGR